MSGNADLRPDSASRALGRACASANPCDFCDFMSGYGVTNRPHAGESGADPLHRTR